MRYIIHYCWLFSPSLLCYKITEPTCQKAMLCSLSDLWPFPSLLFTLCSQLSDSTLFLFLHFLLNVDALRQSYLVQAALDLAEYTRLALNYSKIALSSFLWCNKSLGCKGPYPALWNHLWAQPTFPICKLPIVWEYAEISS